MKITLLYFSFVVAYKMSKSICQFQLPVGNKFWYFENRFFTQWTEYFFIQMVSRVFEDS